MRALRLGCLLALSLAALARSATAGDEPPKPPAPPTDAALDGWVAKLAEPATASEAERALLDAGPRATAAAARGLSNDAEAVRRAAARVLPRLRLSMDGREFAAARPALKKGESCVRAAAARLLLRNAYAGTRREAVESLDAGQDAADSAAILRTALDDDDAEVRQAALAAVKRLGPSAASVVPDLLKRMAEVEARGRAEIVDAVAATRPAPEALAPLFDAFPRDTSAVRARIVAAVVAADPKGEATRALVRRALDDPWTWVRNAAALAAFDLGVEDPSMRQPALRSLLDPQGSLESPVARRLRDVTRDQALWWTDLLALLEEVPFSESESNERNPLENLLETWVRARPEEAARLLPTATPLACRRLLSRFASLSATIPQAAPLLLEVVPQVLRRKDLDDDAVRSGFSVLRHGRKVEQGDALVAPFLSDPDSRLRRLAAEALQGSSVSEDVMARSLSDQDPAKRLGALSLVAVRPSLSSSLLAAAGARMEDDDPGVRAAALRAVLPHVVRDLDSRPTGRLADAPREVTGPLLREALADPDAEVRWRAAVALAFLREAAPPALDTLRALLSDPAPRVAEAAARALDGAARAKGVSLRDLLKADLESKEPVRAAAACLALAGAGGYGPVVLPLLEAALAEKDPKALALALRATAALGREAKPLAGQVSALAGHADPDVARLAKVALAAIEGR